MSSNVSCSVYGCFNTNFTTKNKHLMVSFYTFPGRKWEADRKKIWINFAKRKNPDGTQWSPTTNSRICSAHFLNNECSEDPRSPNYNPTIYPTGISKDQMRFLRLKKRTQAKKALEKADPVGLSTESSMDDELPVLDIQLKTIASQTDYGNFTMVESLQEFTCRFENNSVSTSVKHLSLELQPLPSTITCKNKSYGGDFKCPNFAGYSSVQDSEDKLKELTSVSADVFALLLSLLPEQKPQPKKLRKEDKLLLTLMKLKIGISFVSISVLFGIHRSTASRIFETTLVQLCEATKFWIFWPSQKSVRDTLPSLFKDSYPKVRVIIDCTEIETETPPTVEQRIHVFSSYKNAYTVKYFIGITPLGLICFLSQGYGGGASDSFITNDCGFLDKLESGDTVLADKVFPNINVKDGVVLVEAPFSEPGQNQFNSTDVQLAYQIAGVRIYVERAIQRLKIFNILNHKVPVELLSRMDKIVHLCAVLANLQPLIIKE